MYPITVLGFILLAAVTIAPVTYFAATPYVVPPEVLALEKTQTQAGEVAALSREPHYFSVMPPPTADTVTADAPTAEPPVAVAVATPNHDPDRVHSLAASASGPETLSLETVRAEPEQASLAAPVTFTDADTTLYAKEGARLRAGPNIKAEVLTKLAADAPLHATARSADGAWWKVSLDGGRSGYVHRLVVSKDRAEKMEPPAAPTPLIAEVPPAPAPAARRPGMLGYADEAVDWFTDTARRGSAPAIIRTER